MTLYQKILLFLIQAACYCNQGKVGHSFKDAIKLNDWDKRLKDVQNAEKTVFDLDLDIKAQQTALYQRTILTERRDEKDDACLARLRLSDPSLDKKRIEDIKGGLLRESYSWILDSREFNAWEKDGGLLWIRGDPGKGKTMLLCGTIDELHGRKAYFFCQATNKAINSGVAALRGLIYIMADENPHLIAHIRKRLDKCNDVFDANSWYILSEVFEAMISATEDVHIIADALDECIEGRRELLRFILRNRTKAKWIISSRNHSDIEEELQRAPSLSLEVNSASVSQAVDRYIQYKVDQLADRKSYDLETKSFVLGYLRQNAHDTFLWVALVCTNLAETGQWLVKPTLRKFPPGLTEVYQRMWHMVLEKDDSTGLLQQILAVSALVLRPLTLKELRVLVEIPNKTAAFLANVLQVCGSFLTVRQDVLEFVHQSAKEYIDGRIPDTTQRVHSEIFSRSICTMFRVLRKDVYDLKDPDSSISQLRISEPDPLAEINYSCVYWIQHLINSKTASLADSKKLSPMEDNLVRRFLTSLYLPWLEATSLLKSTAATLMMVHDLESLISESHRYDKNGKELATSSKALIYDARRFFQYFRDTLQTYPLQIYYAGILFSPENSTLRINFAQDGPSDLRVIKYADIEWSPLLTKLKMHADENLYGIATLAVCFCHETKRLAMSFSNGLVQIRQIVSMEIIQENKVGIINESQTDMTTHLAFSPNNDKIVCHRDSGIVTIWDLHNDQLMDLDLGNVVNVSPDGRLVAQTTSNVIQIHSILETESCFYKPIGVTSYVSRDRSIRKGMPSSRTLLVFSSDSNSIAVQTAIHTIAVWDISPARLRCEISTSNHRLVAIGLGNRCLGVGEACEEDDELMKEHFVHSLYQLDTGCIVWTHRLAFGGVCDIQISSDDRFMIASGFESHIFDSMSGTCVQRTMVGEYTWLSRNLQYILMVAGMEPSFYVTLREWVKPESDTGVDIKEFPFPDRIMLLSCKGHRVEMHNSTTDCGNNILDLDTYSRLWHVERHILSRSMELVVIKNGQESDLMINKLQLRGVRIMSPTLPKGETISLCSIAPDDLHVAMVTTSNNVKIWEVATQTEVYSIELMLPCSKLQWSLESRRLIALAASGFMLVDIESKRGILRIDGASFVAFSEDISSFMMWIDDATRASVYSSPKEAAAARKAFRRGADEASCSGGSARSGGSISGCNGTINGGGNSGYGQENPKSFPEASVSREWPLNGRSQVGDLVEWDIVNTTGQAIEGFHLSGYSGIRDYWKSTNNLRKKLCYNSQILVICEDHNHGFHPILRVWNRASGKLLVYSRLPRCVYYDSMILKGRTLHFNCGVISIGPKDIAFGSSNEIFYDGQWIWKEKKKVVRVSLVFEHELCGDVSYENKTLGLNRQNGGYIVLRCR